MKQEFGIFEGFFFLIMQGVGLNIDCGVEEVIEVVCELENIVLMIVGDGDIIFFMCVLVEQENFGEKVVFYGKCFYMQLLQFIWYVDIGLSFDKLINLNYWFFFFNKVFDYIYIGIFIICLFVMEVFVFVCCMEIGEVLEVVMLEFFVEKVYML